jgi:hypothetical protein
MAALTYQLEPMQRAFEASVRGVLAAVEETTEHDLLASSRCHGWTRHDVVVHLVAGWQEMLGGMVSRVSDEATVDAASYWPAFAAEFGSDDPVDVLMAQRRRGASYARPAAAVAQLREVGEALLRGCAVMPDEPCTWQGHVFTAGDFLAVWVVEDAVHHLDLDLDLPPAESLRTARATVEALLDQRLPDHWDDTEAVLVGTGRLRVPAEAAALADRLPALG